MHICTHCGITLENALEHGQHEECCRPRQPLTGMADARVRELMRSTMRPIVEQVEPLIASARSIGLDDEADRLEQSIAMYR